MTWSIISILKLECRFFSSFSAQSLNIMAQLFSLDVPSSPAAGQPLYTTPVWRAGDTLQGLDEIFQEGYVCLEDLERQLLVKQESEEVPMAQETSLYATCEKCDSYFNSLLLYYCRKCFATICDDCAYKNQTPAKFGEEGGWSILFNEKECPECHSAYLCEVGRPNKSR